MKVKNYDGTRNHYAYIITEYLYRNLEDQFIIDTAALHRQAENVSIL